MRNAMIVVILFTFLSISFAKQRTGNSKFIFAKDVDEVSCVEPLAIRAKVVAVNVSRKRCLIRVASETLRGRYIVLEGCTIIKSGGYVRGVYCSGQFSFLKGGFEKR